jgi:hypothetical protein
VPGEGRSDVAEQTEGLYSYRKSQREFWMALGRLVEYVLTGRGVHLTTQKRLSIHQATGTRKSAI